MNIASRIQSKIADNRFVKWFLKDSTEEIFPDMIIAGAVLLVISEFLDRLSEKFIE